MAYCGFIVTVKEIKKHSNADRLQITELKGCQVIVGLDVQVGDRGVLFPAEGQLSQEFAEENGLLRKKDIDGTPIGNGYLDPIKRNISTLRLRGEKSEGIFLPLSCLEKYVDITTLADNTEITSLNGTEICCKYIPAGKNGGPKGQGQGKVSSAKRPKVFFPEHVDTKQLKFCFSDFAVGDILAITEKLEGTSGRSACLEYADKPSFWQKLFHISPKKSLHYFCGSRRVVLDSERDTNGGYYGDNSFRVQIHEYLKPFLKPNMQVFYEIVGFLPTGAPIMGSISTEPLKDKNFTKKYGKHMNFNYGCETGRLDFYIYRIVELEGDDIKYEYSTCQIRDWCKTNGFKTVPLLWFGTLESEEQLTELAEKFCDGESTLAPHWREGCVIRRENISNKFSVYKHKNFTYRLLKGMFVSEMEANSVLTEDILEEM